MPPAASPSPVPKSTNGKLLEMRKAITKSSKFVNKNRQLSVEWFQRKIRELGLDLVKRQAYMTSDLGQLVSGKEEGLMYLFAYDPKHKKTLPYYDTFPLVIPFDVQDGTMLGINLHYLPVRLRVKLFDRLMELSVNNRTKIQVTWDLLKGYAQFPEVKPCVKQYLFTHIASRRLLKIHPTDWRLAVNLPLQSFQKASDRAVWTESRRIISP